MRLKPTMKNRVGGTISRSSLATKAKTRVLGIAAPLRPVAGIMTAIQGGAAKSARSDGFPRRAGGPHHLAARSLGLNAPSRAGFGRGPLQEPAPGRRRK